jgi:hypothetical protein
VSTSWFWTGEGGCPSAGADDEEEDEDDDDEDETDGADLIDLTGIVKDC